jgi:hypothetical protein
VLGLGEVDEPSCALHWTGCTSANLSSKPLSPSDI